jgi:hypothetical protein
LNYNPYYLYEGNLGLVETAVKGTYTWKLHIDSPLYPGTYDVEANIYNVDNDVIVASDDTKNELTILPKPNPWNVGYSPNLIGYSPPTSIAQKAAVVAGLMNSLTNLFGNSGVGGPSPSVHPTQDDQSSSSLAARGSEEREEDPRVKSKDKVVDEASVPPKKHNFDVTDAAAAAEKSEDKAEETPKMDNAQQDLGDAKQAQDANQDEGKKTIEQLEHEAKSRGETVTVIDADGNRTYERY